MTNDTLTRLHFRELALRFLDGMNPQPDRAIVIADAICSYDGELDASQPMRYQAHDFFHEAIAVIQNRKPLGHARRYTPWLLKWNEEYGIGND